MLTFAAEILLALCFLTYDMNESTALHAFASLPATSAFRPLTSFVTSLAATPGVARDVLISASYPTSGGIATHAVLPTAFVVIPITHVVCDVALGIDTKKPSDAAMHDGCPALG
jgi:hypothetical protein